MGWAARHALITLSASIPVAASYLPLPLLTLIGTEFGLSDAELGLAASAMPIGFAFGVLTLIPLSDRVQPRTLSQVQAAAAGVLLFVAALAPTFPTLFVVLALAGVAGSFAQMLAPVGLRLAPAGSVGMAGAVLAGAFGVAIFTARVGGAWVGGAIGWRPVFAIFGVMMVALVAVVRVAVPTSTECESRRSYWSILAGLPGLAARNPVLVGMATAQAGMFFAFQGLWSIMALQFTSAPFNWSVAQAGLIGLAGIAAGLLAFGSGRLVDRWGSSRSATLSVAVAVLASVLIAVAPWSAAAVAAGMFLLCLALQTSQAATQPVALRAAPVSQAGSANTVYVFCMFIGGSLGAASASWLFSLGGAAAVALSTIGAYSVAFVLRTVLVRPAHGGG